MEGPPDGEDARGTAGSVGHQRPPVKPNLWILVGMTALALVISVLVLIATTL